MKEISFFYTKTLKQVFMFSFLYIRVTWLQGALLD